MKTLTLSMLTCLLASSMVLADVSTFTETFDSGDSGWLTAINTAPTYNPAGGPDGTGAIAFDASFLNLGSGTVFRDSATAGNASGGAFAGDWVTSRVQTLSFSFRHNAPVPVGLFARIAPPANFPGAIASSFAPALPNQWTDVTLSVVEGSPNLVSFSGGSYDAIFPNIGNLQIAVSAPDGFEDSTVDYTFELDNVNITAAIPEPTAALAMLSLAGVAFVRRNRR